MFQQHYAGVERQCYWAWGEIRIARKFLKTGTTNTRLFRRPSTASQATRWEQTSVGRTGMKIEALIGKFGGPPSSRFIADHQ